MPRNTDVDDSGGDQPKLTFFERLRYTMVKPDDSGKVKDDEPELSREELEATIARADDKERNIGLVAAPLGAIVALFVSADLIHHAQQTGQSTSTYQTLTFVLLGMAVLMLVVSWLRKRLFMGIVMALFGLGIFNLHYWGFGVPFLLAGSWYLVRAWRLQFEAEAGRRGLGAQLWPAQQQGVADQPAAVGRRGAAPSQQALHAAHREAQATFEGQARRLIPGEAR